MKKISLFIISILFLIPLGVFALPEYPKVLTLDASSNDKFVNYSGTTEDGSLAVMCKLYDSEDNELDKLSTAVEDNNFEGTFTVSASGDYEVACANYEGGEIKRVSTVVDEIIYTVSFDTNGGDPVGSQQVAIGGKATDPGVPTRDGYSFLGWHSDQTLNVLFDFDTPITDNITLYADWEPVFTITFDFNGGTRFDETSYVDHMVSFGMFLTTDNLIDWLEVIAPANMELDAVEIDDVRRELGDVFEVNHDATIKYLWKYIDGTSYTVHFETYGGSAIEDQNVEPEQLAIQPEDPKKDGFVFAGWYTDDTFNVEFDFNTPITADTPIFAKWDILIYEANGVITEPIGGQHPDMTIEPDGEGYTIEFKSWYLYESPYPELNESDTFEKGQTYAVRFVFEPEEGYAFSNETTFNLNGQGTSCYGAEENREMIFYEIPGEMFIITFDPNGGTFADLDEENAVEAQIIQLPYLDEERVIPPQGKEFDAFEIAGVRYEVDDEYELTSDVTVKLLWKDIIQMHLVTIDPNGGTLLMEENPFEVPEMAIPLEALSDEEIIPPQDKEFDAYEIAGVRYEAGSNYTVTDDITIKVLWKDVAKENYTVTFNSNGGSAVENQVVVSGSKANKPSDPTKGGHEFAGWYIDETLNDAFDFNTPITDNITLFAKWEEVKPVEISTLNITVASPKVGDVAGETTKPSITLDENANYELDWTAYITAYPSQMPEGYDNPFVGTFESNKSYYVEVSLVAKEGYAFTDNEHMVLKVNGKTTNYEMNEYNGAVYYMFYVQVDPVIVYEYIEGAGQEYTVGKNEEAKFRINAEFTLFENGGAVYVDDKLVNKENYTAESGSTVIKFTKAYMSTLSAGNHTLTVTFNNGGAANTTFTVSETDNPLTNDSIFIWLSLFIVSLVGLVIGTLKLRKATSK